MRIAMLLIVLGFPLVDVYATIRFARWTGVPVYVWLVGAALIGFSLLRNERTAFREATIAAMHGEQPLLRGLLDSGRKVLAGILFVLPGIMSDILALMLLALPLNVGRDLVPRPAPAHYGRGRKTMEGDFRRVS